ncbi:hypothetical protein BpHYR1_001055 [Brachionus plicatilis]|uniref:Uncharacterized protein n=1 Tax=Brachionus plicatilis TaxID=10195 RepID=A0A3M7QG75_BRAPC|nr:hypothetical protein BpHYR1_001055 [Brachionus plicatilis]
MRRSANKGYVGAFVNSSRICSNKISLCGIWNEINEWMIENGNNGGGRNKCQNGDGNEDEYKKKNI